MFARAKITTKSATKKREQPKFKGRDYTASVIIEILELQGKLDSALYSNIEIARKARNRWAHDLELPSSREVHSCMAAAQAMLSKFVGITLRLQQSAEEGAFPKWQVNIGQTS